MGDSGVLKVALLQYVRSLCLRHKSYSDIFHRLTLVGFAWRCALANFVIAACPYFSPDARHSDFNFFGNVDTYNTPKHSTHTFTARVSSRECLCDIIRRLVLVTFENFAHTL